MDKTKNIIQVFASSFWGGGEVFVYDLGKELIKDNYNIVFVSKKSKVIKEKLQNIAPCYQLPLKGIFDIYSAFLLSKIIRKENISIIHCHNFKTAFICLYAKILSKKDVRIILSRHFIKKAKKGFIYMWLYRHIEKIIFVSNAALEEFAQTYKGDKTKLCVIHNSIKEPKINETISIRTKLNIPPSTFLLAFVGRLEAEKGVEVLLNAVCNLKNENIFLIIIGRGEKEYEEKLKDIVRKNEIEDKVNFLGFSKDVPSIIKDVDIGICPSIWREAGSLSIIEFMLLGKVVISTNNGAQKEYIENFQTGILIEPNDSYALTNAIKQLINNPKQISIIGNNAKQYFEKELSYNKFYQKIKDIYQE
ncbi:MAG: glycosyltransferase family 4 protein [Bacteroidales bacterium]|nr:glycosyltransferase family 4 protein [Bacteroidales bacterium]